MKTPPLGGRAHPQLHCPNLKLIGQTVPELLTFFYISYSCGCSTHTLPECPPLHLLHLICLPWPTKCQYMYHSLHMTGLLVTRCKSFAYLSVSLRLGPEVARSKLRKNLIIYSASWAKRAMLPWTDGYQQMKHTRTDPVKFLDYIESTLDDEISP